jgi:hypothetical protein
MSFEIDRGGSASPLNLRQFYHDCAPIEGTPGGGAIPAEAKFIDMRKTPNVYSNAH